MRKKLLLMGVLGLSFFAQVGASENVTIDLVDDYSVPVGSSVSLEAAVGGTCSNMSISTIYWMEQNDHGDWWTIQSGGIGNTTFSYTATATRTLKVQIRCPLGAGPLYFSEAIDEDIITVTVTQAPAGSGPSPETKEKDALKQIFEDNTLLQGIKIQLDLLSSADSPVLSFGWTSLGGGDLLDYELEYSTGATFASSRIFHTSASFMPIVRYTLDQESFVHYFRVKATYNHKSTPYSNVIKFYTQDPFSVRCQCAIKLPIFTDIFSDTTSILDRFYSPMCKKCRH